MPNFAEGVVTFARQAMCSYFTNGANLADFFAGTRAQIGPVNVNGGALMSASAAIGQSLWCPNDVPVGGFQPLSLPFTGGQCVGDEYQVTGNYDFFVNGVLVTPGQAFIQQGTVVGPVEDVFIGGNGRQIFALHNFGQQTIVFQNGSTSVQFQNLQNVQLNNITNPSDPCGDLPAGGDPLSPPINGDPFSGNIDYDDVGGNPISLPGTGTPSSPVIGPGGEPVVCVRVETSIGNLQVCFPMNGGEPRIGLPGTDPTDCCDPGENPEADPPPTSEPDPPDTPRQRIVAVVATVTPTAADFSETVIFGDSNTPDLWVPDLGLVSFAQKVGSTSVWSEWIRIQGRQVRVECPFPSGAIDVRSIARPTASISLTKIFANIPEEQP